MKQQRIDAAQAAITRTRQLSQRLQEMQQQQQQKAKERKAQVLSDLTSAREQFRLAKEEEEFRVQQEETKRQLYLSEASIIRLQMHSSDNMMQIASRQQAILEETRAKYAILDALAKVSR